MAPILSKKKTKIALIVATNMTATTKRKKVKKNCYNFILKEDNDKVQSYYSLKMSMMYLRISWKHRADVKMIEWPNRSGRRV